MNRSAVCAATLFAALAAGCGHQSERPSDRSPALVVEAGAGGCHVPVDTVRMTNLNVPGATRWLEHEPGVYCDPLSGNTVRVELVGDEAFD